MTRSELFAEIPRALALAGYCDAHSLQTSEVLGRARDSHVRLINRREALRKGCWTGAGLLGAAGLARSQTSANGPRIAIVGAGLAGLVCADQLRSKGYAATLFDASN